MPINLIPRPASLTSQPGVHVLNDATAIATDAACREEALYLATLLRPGTGYPFAVVAAATPGARAIVLHCGVEDDELGQEGYALSITPDQIQIEAPTPAGVFYAIQTLRQLLPPAIEQREPQTGAEWVLPCLQMRDWPRFGWRGFMLDDGRYFHGKATVLRALDQMALHKLNVFHWHLTEDQGWRIEINRYPRLTAVGAWRKGTAHSMNSKPDAVPHGGFYTQDEIREVVAYAARLHIQVVPEIEMPGHATAALAAYPELSCTGGPFEVAQSFGIWFDLMCAGKDSVFEFLNHVLDEVVPLFPSPFFHVGGDEAPKRRWHNCPDCQRRMHNLYLKDEHQLQLYFTNRVAAHLATYSKRIVGWNQMIGPGLIDSAVAQYWIMGRDEFIAAVNGGRDGIISDWWHTYLDHSYSHTSLKKAYTFEPILKGIDRTGAAHVLGAEAPIWCEWVPSEARMDYQVQPRLAALAEVCWTPPALKSYPDFRRRLVHLLQRFDLLGIRYAPIAAVDPGPIREKFGVLTMVQPQWQTAD